MVTTTRPRSGFRARSAIVSTAASDAEAAEAVEMAAELTSAGLPAAAAACISDAVGGREAKRPARPSLTDSTLMYRSSSYEQPVAASAPSIAGSAGSRRM